MMETKRQIRLVNIMVKECIGRPPRGKNPLQWFISKFNENHDRATTLLEFFKQLSKTNGESITLQEAFDEFHGTKKSVKIKKEFKDKKSSGEGDKPSRNNFNSKSHKYEKQSQGGKKNGKHSCKMCGKFHPPPCAHGDNPDANHSDAEWADSDKGKAWEKLNYTSLPWRTKLSEAKPRAAEPDDKPPQNKRKWHGEKSNNKKQRNCKSDSLNILQSVTDYKITPLPHR
jgi:hypothetical protein